MDDVIVADRDALATAPWRTRAAAAVARASWLQRGERLLPHLLAVGYAGVSVAVVAHVDVVPRSYAATSTPAAIVDLAAGLGLIAAGAADAINRQRGSVGLLVTMIGVAWLSADWVGWSDGPAIARSAAMVVAPFLLPLLIHLCIALPTGRVTGRLDRCAVAVAYGVSASVSLSWALLRDPFRDRYCWANCTDNSFLVAAKPELVRSITALWLYSSLVAAVVLAATSAWRFLRQSSTARRTLAAPFGAAVVVVATHALYTVLVLADRAESPSRRALAVVFYMRAAALVGLAAGILWTLLRGLRTRRAVARLAVELGDAPPPGTLRAALARSLDDDHLEVYYWLPASGVYVNDAGEPADPQPGPTQALTPLERDGQPVAVVIHDRLLKTTHDLQHEIGAASRLAVDNERLRAQALAQLSELRASRARIVETADTTRQELERNLHDGAQQRLLALSYELQLAESDARATGDTLLAEMLVMAGQKATTALVELRDLAHGIFPAILAEAGLSPALATLADTAPLRVEFADVPDGRLPDDVETAVYMAVTAIVEHAARRSAKRILGAFTAGDGELGVELIDDGDTTSIDDLIHVADRVGALGGRLDVDGTRLRMVLPCA